MATVAPERQRVLFQGQEARVDTARRASKTTSRCWQVRSSREGLFGRAGRPVRRLDTSPDGRREVAAGDSMAIEPTTPARSVDLVELIGACVTMAAFVVLALFG